MCTPPYGRVHIKTRGFLRCFSSVFFMFFFGVLGPFFSVFWNSFFQVFFRGVLDVFLGVSGNVFFRCFLAAFWTFFSVFLT